jgi:hypothetical protein
MHVLPPATVLPAQAHMRDCTHALKLELSSSRYAQQVPAGGFYAGHLPAA